MHFKPTTTKLGATEVIKYFTFSPLIQLLLKYFKWESHSVYNGHVVIWSMTLKLCTSFLYTFEISECLRYKKWNRYFSHTQSFHTIQCEHTAYSVWRLSSTSTFPTHTWSHVAGGHVVLVVFNPQSSAQLSCWQTTAHRLCSKVYSTLHFSLQTTKHLAVRGSSFLPCPPPTCHIYFKSAPGAATTSKKTLISHQM